MLYKKPVNLKYTDLCIYIDANMEKLRNPGEFPDVEETIYNYLWLVVKALAIKQRMFQKFEDYDGYAFYAANRLFFALRKNLNNQGKMVKGKLIRPIKSCLNYMKALLYPMRIEYQREVYEQDFYQEIMANKFDSFAFTEKLKSSAREEYCQKEDCLRAVRDTFNSIDSILNKVLEKSPFKPDSLDYKRLKMSVLLSCLAGLRLKSKLDFSIPTTVLWKLPKSMSSFVQITTKEFITAFKAELMDCFSATIDDKLLECIIENPNGVVRQDDEYKY